MNQYADPEGQGYDPASEIDFESGHGAGHLSAQAREFSLVQPATACAEGGGGVSDSEREARMALACVSEPANLSLTAMVRAEGALDIWRLLRGGDVDSPTGRRARNLRLADVHRAMEECRARFIVPGDAEWPVRLDDLAEACLLTQNLGGQVFGLWASGPGRLAEWVSDSVSIVGSRASTAYGEGVATDLAADFVQTGGTVVSGGAYGIDAAAHRGALSMSGRTIAVLANGVDQPYPRGNTRLFEALRSDGLIVSELAPGNHPTRVRFLSRNRVIAALSEGTVIVEAAIRSGARNTVAWAELLGRRVMAVPGPVTSALSVNPHLLIRQRSAELVTCAAEIRELIAPIGEELLEQPRGRARVLDSLDEVTRTVFEAVPGRGGRSADELALSCGLDVLSVLDALGELETLALVEHHAPAGWKIVAGSVG